jgi:RNA polymerase sigma factor (sigma-70 family)
MRPDSPTSLLDDLRWLRTLAGKLTRDSHLADDAVQEAGALALSQPEPPMVPRAWLVTVLRNLLSRHRRSQRTRQARETTVGERRGTGEDGAALLERAEVQHRLAAAVLRLDEPYRSTVLLRFFEALPPRRIAKQLGVPVATVHSRLQRALQQLRTQLDATAGGRGHWLAALIPIAIPTPLLPLPGLGLFAMQLKLQLLTAAAVLACFVPFWWPSAASADGDLDVRPHIANAAASDHDGGSRGKSSPANPAAQRERVERTAVAATPSAEHEAAVTFAVTGRAIDCSGTGVPDLLLAPNGQGDHAIRSDAAGNFTLELAGATTSIVTCDEHYVTVLGATWSPSTSIAPIVVVARKLALAGRVVDELGLPVGSAQIEVQMPADFETRFPMPLDRCERGRWQCSTAADGTFTLADVPGIDGADLLAAAELFAPSSIALPQNDAKDLQIVVQRFHFAAGELNGRVIDAGGAPVQGARVVMGVTSVASDADGRFALSLRRAGWPTAIVAAKAGHGPARLEVPRNGGKTREDWPRELVLRLGTAPQTVRGRVQDQDRHAIAGAEVWIDDPTPFGNVGMVPLQLEYLVGGGVVPRRALTMPVPAADDPTADDNFMTQLSNKREATASWYFVTSDAEGNFEVPGLLDRTYTLKALDPATGLLGEVSGVTGSSYQTIEITQHDLWPELRGRVLSRSGRPIAGVDVEQQITAFSTKARVPGGHLQGGIIRAGRSAVTDADGWFVLHDVGKKGSTFTVSGDAIVPTQLEVASITDPRNCMVTAEARCHVEVVLVDANEADSVMAFSANGTPIPLAVLRNNSNTFTSRIDLHNGHSGLFVVGESTTSVTLMRGDVKVRQIGIHPDPTQTTTVQ